VLLGDVTVQAVDDSGGGAFSSGGGQDLVISVAPPLAQRVIEALDLDGAAIRAGILSGSAVGGANDALPGLGRCAAAPTS
jgi:hypothetical protein